MSFIRVRISSPGMADWFATAPPSRSSPVCVVNYLNKVARRRRVPATYALATEAEYQAYRNQIKEALK